MVRSTQNTMNTKSFATLIFLFTCLILPVTAKDGIPRGYKPLSELQETLAKAKGKKLVVLVVKGMDDSCPNCATTLENGNRAVGSGVVKLFARAETIEKEDDTDFTSALKNRIKQKFITGSAVAFVVFNPDMTEIIVQANRKELQSNKKAIAEFKKTVKEAKKALKK